MVFQFVILQMCMHSPILGCRHAFFVLSESFTKVSSIYLQTAKALARLHLCAGSSEPLLVACAISTLSPCASSNLFVT